MPRKLKIRHVMAGIKVCPRCEEPKSTVWSQGASDQTDS